MKFRRTFKVETVQNMGSDEMIARAARVSTGKDLLEQDKIEGLIGYLVRERHTSPLESCVVTFRIEAPIFVAREWMRHRSQCLSGSSIISFSRPCDNHHYPYELKRLYKNWNDPAQRERLQNMILRTMDEETHEVVEAGLQDVIYSGKKEVYRVALSDGSFVDGTLEHRVFTSHGWKRIKELSLVEDQLYVYDSFAYRDRVPQFVVDAPDLEWRDIPGYEGQYQVSDAGNVRSFLNQKRNLRETPILKKRFVSKNGYLTVGLSKRQKETPALTHALVARAFLGPVPEGHEVRHLDGNRLNSTLGNLSYGTSKKNSEDMKKHGTIKVPRAVPVSIERIDFKGTEDTYDIVVDGSFHNFFANGIVVHNSYNELSLRYTESDCEFYVPPADRPLVNDGSSAHPELVDGSTRQMHIVTSEATFLYRMVEESYRHMLEMGIAQEVARNVLPVSTYTAFYATANLNNWLKFLDLRNGDKGHPQWEIVQCAQMVQARLTELYPITMGAWRG